MLLRLQHLDKRASLTRVTRRARDGVPPGTGITWVAGEEIGEPREVERVVGGQAPDPREATNVYGKTTAQGRVPPGWGRGGQTSVGLHLPVLLQSDKRSVKKTAVNVTIVRFTEDIPDGGADTPLVPALSAFLTSA